MFQLRPWLPAIGLTFAATLPAQGESGGFFPGIPAALSLEGSAGTSGDTLHLKMHGFQNAQPPVWPSTHGPVIDLASILGSCAGQCCGGGRCPGTGIDVDALSMGEDWVLADNATGRIAFPPNWQGWAAITFSVSRGSQGAAGSRVRAESSGGGAESDVFSWVLPGSAIPMPLVSRTERAHDSTEIDLSGIPNAELDALDHLLPMFGLDPGMRAMMPGQPTIFFSVSNATKGMVPCAWWNGTPPSGATILQVSYQAATRSWSCPTPFKTFRDLGLADPNEDLDALAVDLRTQRILFSTKNPMLDEILFLYCGTDNGTPMPYEDQNGTPVSTSIGLLQSDGVDAICAMDPTLLSAAPSPFHFYIGTPRPGVMPRPPQLEPAPSLSASALRNYDPVMAEILIDTWMVGWPASGPGPGVAVLALTFGNSQSPVFVLKLAPRNWPNPPFAGDPQHGCVTVPVNWSLMGNQITLRWFAVGSGGGLIAEAWPILTEI